MTFQTKFRLLLSGCVKEVHSFSSGEVKPSLAWSMRGEDSTLRPEGSLESLQRETFQTPSSIPSAAMKFRRNPVRVHPLLHRE